jgi:ABC-type transporter Mla MlaB component
MRISHRQFGPAAVLDFHGSLVGPKAAALVEAAVRRVALPRNSVIVLNLSEVPAVDSAGLNALREARRTLQDAACIARLAGVARRLSNLLVIARLVMIYDSFITVEDALADVRTQLESASPGGRCSLLLSFRLLTALLRV